MPGGTRRDSRRAAGLPPSKAWTDDADPPVRRWSRQEADTLLREQPPLSPWRVVLAQLAVGAVAAAMAGAIGGAAWAWSALYGGAVVAVPGVLMARAATSRVAAVSPAFSTAYLLAWACVKVAVSVVLLALAPRLVPGLVWPVLLATLFVAMQTYWFALLWRGRPS